MKRVITALVLIPLFAYLIIWSPPWLFLIAVAAVAALCFREFAGLVALHKIEPPGLLGYAGGLLLLLLPQADQSLVVLIALFAMALSLRYRELAQALTVAAALVLGVLYTFGSLHCAVLLRGKSTWWAFFAISLNWVGDIAALYVGRVLGRHKLSPHISPAKSVEGAIASLVASVGYAAIYFPRVLPAVPLWKALVIAAIANIAGQIGDLCESAFKRGAGVKDSGTLLPGHGGWLDRLDSALFSVPVVWLLVAALV